jgi:hypothetical protein
MLPTNVRQEKAEHFTGQWATMKSNTHHLTERFSTTDGTLNNDTFGIGFGFG